MAFLPSFSPTMNPQKNIGSSDTEFRKQMYLYQRYRLKELKIRKEIPYQKDNQEHEEQLMRYSILQHIRSILISSPFISFGFVSFPFVLLL